jgi:hypothetical protein
MSRDRIIPRRLTVERNANHHHSRRYQMPNRFLLREIAARVIRELHREAAARLSYSHLTTTNCRNHAAGARDDSDDCAM